MKNRDVLNLILACYETGTKAQIDFFTECTAQRDIDTEDGPVWPDLAAAFRDAEDLFERNGPRASLISAREAGILAGYYTVMTPIEIENIIISRGTIWSFKLKGKPYQHRKYFSDWLEDVAIP